MTNKIVHQKPNLSKILRQIVEYYEHDNILLIELALELGATKAQVAKKLGVVPSAINHRFTRSKRRLEAHDSL